MGTPFEPRQGKDKGLRGTLQTTQTEVVSAMSALNMHPDPIRDHVSTSGYLSETDGGCKHAMEHLQNIMEWSRVTDKKLNTLEDTIFKAAKAGTIDDDTIDTLLAILRGPSSFNSKD